LTLDDWRCADALPESLAEDSARLAFAGVLRKYWVDEPLYHVVDLRERFLLPAEALQHDSRPAASLLLYCAWIEATLTLLLVRCAQRSGKSGRDADEYAETVAKRSAGENASSLLRTPLAQPVPTDLAKRTMALFKLRKFAIHFRWVGTDERVLNLRLQRLLAGVSHARALVHDLRAVERRATTLARHDDVLRVFAIS
jgi:hypothetical protein